MLRRLHAAGRGGDAMEHRILIRRDERGAIEGMPLQLMIAVIVAGIALAIILGWVLSIQTPNAIGRVDGTPEPVNIQGDPLAQAATKTVTITLRAYDRKRVASRVEGEVLRLTRAAQQYAVAGGGAETLTLDFRGGLFASVEYVWIGDRPGGSFANVVRYRISGEGERVVLVERPAVSLAGPDNRTLALRPGAYEIHMEVLHD